MKVTCPECRKETDFKDNPYRPFCSERCQLIDLGEWALEKRGLPADDQTPSADEESVKKSEESE
ncbi:MAG: DNA gyrase inhibitor YacG [Bdellovibrionia bacterium]